MTELKKYTSFEDLKSDEKPTESSSPKDVVFSEFETFVKQLRSEYSNKKKSKTNNGK